MENIKRRNKVFLRLFLLFFVFCFLLIGFKADSKPLIPAKKSGILAVSYLQGNEIKVAIANNSSEEKKLIVSYGYYELIPVKIQSKQITVKPEEILLFGFKNPKLKSGIRLYDTIFINQDSPEEELITIVNIQKFHPSVNYFTCNKFLINENNTCKILLKLNPQDKGTSFFILNNNLQLMPDNNYKTNLSAKPFFGLKEASEKDLENAKIEKDYIEKIKKDSENGKVFTGSGYLYLKLNVDNIKEPVIVSPVIKEYYFSDNEVTLGDLTTPQILFYPADKKIRVIK